jgi:hypothetical protein
MYPNKIKPLIYRTLTVLALTVLAEVHLDLGIRGLIKPQSPGFGFA